MIDRPEWVLAAGELAAETGLGFWREGIHDHSRKDDSECARRCKKRILEMIATKAGSNWTWKKSYKGDGDSAWCGHGAAAFWAPAGLGLGPRFDTLPSTKRLQRDWYRADRKTGAALAGARQIAVTDIVPGTICTIHVPGSDELPCGDHIVIALSPPAADGVAIVQGNAHGEGPDGKRYEGVTRAVVPLKALRRAYFPLAEDLGPIAEWLP